MPFLTSSIIGCGSGFFGNSSIGVSIETPFIVGCYCCGRGSVQKRNRLIKKSNFKELRVLMRKKGSQNLVGYPFDITSLTCPVNHSRHL